MINPLSPAAPGITETPVPPPEAPPQPVRRRRWWHAADSRRTPERPCLNCGDPTVGTYCPSCGQRKVDVRVSLRRMLREVIDDQLSVNSTLPRTLGALFFRPGHLTREYVQGRIVRYIPPFRLYLVSSLLFFIFLPLIADPGQISLNEESQAEMDSIRTARAADSVMLAHAREAGEDTTAYARGMRSTSDVSTGGNIQFGPDPDDVVRPLKPLARRMKQAEARLNSMPPREALRTLIEAFEENAPFGVFVMMPLFAAILKLLYLRRKRFYVEHFVFALHVHAFAFLTGTVIMLAPWDAVKIGMGLWLMIYLFVALKRVYGQPFIRTLIHYVGLGISYSMLLVFGVTATVLMTALSL